MAGMTRRPFRSHAFVFATSLMTLALSQAGCKSADTTLFPDEGGGGSGTGGEHATGGAGASGANGSIGGGGAHSVGGGNVGGSDGGSGAGVVGGGGAAAGGDGGHGGASSSAGGSGSGAGNAVGGGTSVGGSGAGAGNASGGSTASSGGSGGAGDGGAGTGGAPECTTAQDCDDGIGCTVDTCSSGACVHTSDNSLCDDDDYCTGAEVCDPAFGDLITGCTASSGNPCDDGVDCTTDACNSVAESCTNVPSDVACDDGFLCNGSEECDENLGCLAGAPQDCNDGATCTVDFCSTQLDECVHTPSDNICSNSLFCDGVEKCDPDNLSADGTTGCIDGTAINCDDGINCTVDDCDDGAGECTHDTDNDLCQDGLFCNGTETCNATQGCLNGTVVACSDGRSCTSDSCSEVADACVSVPNDSACNDGLFCNGVETCNLAGAGPTGCETSSVPDCSTDGIACTIDACDETTNACTHTASNDLCPDGEFCILPGGTCESGAPCTTDLECADADLCNGVEQCVSGFCNPGTAVDCGDGVDCTLDSCAPLTGLCAHETEDAICDDGAACNGEETCNATLGCVDGSSVVCNDGIACTHDVCTEPSGACESTADNALCDDGALCNGAEICSASLGCLDGSPFVCPPTGVACAAPVCDALTNTCKSQPDNSLCDCGETCDPVQGCGQFCNVKTCQGKVYECGDCLDNDGDCRVDDGDTHCLGPCDNTEQSFYGGIPGQANAPCKQDCYFDQDTGAGNDECYWSHKCDPHEVEPTPNPEDGCSYNPNANIPGTGETCSGLFDDQLNRCFDYCGPLTPNGCDCFGCCEIPGAAETVWLGSENPSGTGSCNLTNVGDPSKCRPCLQVDACLNTCGHCELCVGKPDLPLDCLEQECPNGLQKCGLAGQALCPASFTCITGCCQPNTTEE